MKYSKQWDSELSSEHCENSELGSEHCENSEFYS